MFYVMCLMLFNVGYYHCRLLNASGFYHKLNINILMVEYRGYGLSEGSPSERGLYVDALSALDYLMQRTDIDRTKIIVFGRSLGECVISVSYWLLAIWAFWKRLFIFLQ